MTADVTDGELDDSPWTCGAPILVLEGDHEPGELVLLHRSLQPVDVVLAPQLGRRDATGGADRLAVAASGVRADHLAMMDAPGSLCDGRAPVGRRRAQRPRPGEASIADSSASWTAALE